MVTTTDSLIARPSTPATEKVMKYMGWYRTERQAIKEFFGLDDRIVMDTDGVSVLEVFNDFIDPVILKAKWVQWLPQLEKQWVSKEAFDNLLSKYLNYGKETSIESNVSTDGTAWVEDS